MSNKSMIFLLFIFTKSHLNYLQKYTSNFEDVLNKPQKILENKNYINNKYIKMIIIKIKSMSYFSSKNRKHDEDMYSISQGSQVSNNSLPNQTWPIFHKILWKE